MVMYILVAVRVCVRAIAVPSLPSAAPMAPAPPVPPPELVGPAVQLGIPDPVDWVIDPKINTTSARRDAMMCDTWLALSRLSLLIEFCFFKI
jgi:hypothetical protein